MQRLQNETMGSQILDSQASQTNRADRQCQAHGPYVAKLAVIFGGKTVETDCPVCQQIKKGAKKHEEQESAKKNKADRIRKLLGGSGIPKRFETRTFNNFSVSDAGQEKALKVAEFYANNFEKCLATGASLVFCGKPGTGKTHLAAAIVSAVCNQGRSAVFMSVLKATRMIKDTWRKDAQQSEDTVYKIFIAPDLLVLDEVGVQFGTEAEKLILFEILNGRYLDMKPTIVISNLLPEEITNFLGERVVDRLKEGGGSTIVFGWDSYRAKVVDDANLPKANVAPVDWNSRDNGYRVAGGK